MIVIKIILNVFCTEKYDPSVYNSIEGLIALNSVPRDNTKAYKK